MTSIMQNTNISDNDKQKKLILHVRSILYCYIVNIRFSEGDGKTYFDKANKFFRNEKNIDILKTGKFDSEDYNNLLSSNVFGSWASSSGLGFAAAAVASNSYYPELLDGNNFVNQDGSLKIDGDISQSTTGGAKKEELQKREK